MTSSYGCYRVANNICHSSNSKPKPLRAANYSIVACQVPQPKVSRDLRDELIVKISARDSSDTLVAPATVENEIVFSTSCFRNPCFEMCIEKHFGVCRTVARALDVPTSKPLSIHDSCAKPLTTDVICTRDSATSRTAQRTESHSALDLAPTRRLLCAHRCIREEWLAKIAQVDTRATIRDAHEYNNSRKPQNHNLVVSHPS